MVFQDPLVVSVFTARIVDILRKYVDKSSERLPSRLVSNIMQMIMVVNFYPLVFNLRMYMVSFFSKKIFSFLKKKNNVLERKETSSTLKWYISDLMHIE